jgi:hypothetical protein
MGVASGRMGQWSPDASVAQSPSSIVLKRIGSVHDIRRNAMLETTCCARVDGTASALVERDALVRSGLLPCRSTDWARGVGASTP